MAYVVVTILKTSSVFLLTDTYIYSDMFLFICDHFSNWIYFIKLLYSINTCLSSIFSLL